MERNESEELDRHFLGECLFLVESGVSRKSQCFKVVLWAFVMNLYK